MSIRLRKFGQYVRTCLSDMLDAARQNGKDRQAIADEMNRLIDDPEARTNTKRMLDAYAAVSQTAWRFPLESLPALTMATGDDSLLRLTLTACGYKVPVRTYEDTVEFLADQEVVTPEMVGLVSFMFLKATNVLQADVEELRIRKNQGG